MKMYVAGDWVAGSATMEVRSPFDDTLIDTVPVAVRPSDQIV